MSPPSTRNNTAHRARSAQGGLSPPSRTGATAGSHGSYGRCLINGCFRTDEHQHHFEPSYPPQGGQEPYDVSVAPGEMRRQLLGSSCQPLVTGTGAVWPACSTPRWRGAGVSLLPGGRCWTYRRRSRHADHGWDNTPISIRATAATAHLLGYVDDGALHGNRRESSPLVCQHDAGDGFHLWR